MAERGLSLEDHRSQALTPALLARADFVFCMSDSHRRAVQQIAPEAADRVQLVRPDDQDVADPFGGSDEVYRRTATQIETALRTRLQKVWPLLA